MFMAFDIVLDNMLKTGKFVEPKLNEMFAVSEDFYRGVVKAAVDTAIDEKKASAGKKRLAKEVPGTGIPNDIRVLEKHYRDPEWQKSWERIKKRSGIITERLRKAYLIKLRRKFRDIMPKIQSGQMSITEAKANMRQAWRASKSRVDMIFRTESTKYFTEVQVKFYKGDGSIVGFLFDSVLDTTRSDICRSRHGLIYRPESELLRRNQPPCHPNCRSHLIPLANTPQNLKMLEDPSRDPSKRSVAPLPRGWNK